MYGMQRNRRVNTAIPYVGLLKTELPRSWKASISEQYVALEGPESSWELARSLPQLLIVPWQIFVSLMLKSQRPAKHLLCYP